MVRKGRHTLCSDRYSDVVVKAIVTNLLLRLQANKKLQNLQNYTLDLELLTGEVHITGP